jgi:hypothetical protein
MKSVYSAVRTGDLNKAVCASPVKGLIQIFVSKITCAALARTEVEGYQIFLVFFRSFFVAWYSE